jgi:hypothetical protein
MDWWGYSKNYGWVVLDRKIPMNKPGKMGKLIFIRCHDWNSYEEDRNKWEPPLYIFFERYIESLPTKLKNNAFEKFNYYKKEYDLKRKDLYKEIVSKIQISISEKNNNFLNKFKLQSRGVKRSRYHRIHRTSGCWYCKYPVDNAVDFECIGCGWIICERCGACGCAYQG